MKAIHPGTIIYTLPHCDEGMGSLYLGGDWRFDEDGSVHEKVGAAFRFAADRLSVPLGAPLVLAVPGVDQPLPECFDAQRETLDAIAVARWREQGE